MYDLSIQTYTLNEICDKRELNFICEKTEKLLAQRSLSSIINAFFKSTVVAQNGMLYFRIRDLAQILRTGASGAERVLIYQGVSGVYSPAEIINIDGCECISGSTLCGILDYRINSSLGKHRQYLKFSNDVYKYLVSKCNELREMYYLEIEQSRNKLKKERINRYNITRCEFTGKKFNRLSEVEFAHIEGVVVCPDRALSINNGVIILKEIHAELTRMQALTFREMYEYCQEMGYSLEWTKYVE